ncbi:MAG: porin [Sulfuritalea sp.]|nr:porin [Sulfuritalea sp.]MDP1985455.1 porin [Sulfuritalea sp.]
MQKKLIALAVAGLVSGGAFAQSNVTISGAMDLGLEAISANGATVANTNATSRTRVTNNTSWIRFSGAEDLGGGLKAVFQIEQDVNGDTTGGAFASRNTYVGLAGGFGTAIIGRYDVHYTSHMGVVDWGSSGAMPHAANTLNIIGQVNGVGVIGGRLDNVIAYISPSFGGLTAQLGYTAGSESTTPNLPAKDNAWNLFLKYGNGPIGAFWSHTQVNHSGAAVAVAAVANGPGVLGSVAAAATSGTDVKADRLGAAYTFPMGLKIGLIYDHTKAENAAGLAAKRTAWALPISYKAGANNFYFSYAKAGDVSNAAGNVANTGNSMYALGYAYDMSKRTQVGVSYSRISNDSAANLDFWTRGSGNVAAGADPASFYMGIYHSF